MFRGVHSTIVVLVALLWGVGGIAAPAWAQAGLIGRPLSVCVARIAPGDSPRAMLRTPARFVCGGRQTDHGPGDYWVRSDILPDRAGLLPLGVRVASMWQRDATLHIAYADGSIVVRRLTPVATTGLMQLGALVEVPIPHRGVQATRLLWQIDAAANVRGILNGVRIVTPEASANANLALGALYGVFAGLCGALLVYNLALYAALRHPFQIAYCAMVGALLIYAFSSSGALAWTFSGIANTDRMRINYVALSTSAAAALIFARTFFGTAMFSPGLMLLQRVTVAALLGSGTLFALLAPWRMRLLDQVFAGSFVLLLVTTIAVLWQAWRRRSQYLWLFGLAWALPIALATMRVAGNFNLVRWSFLLDNSTLVSMTVEALLSSIAIAFRMRVVARERDEAREQEIAARLLADRDPLTGLLNRRAFLREAIGRSGAQYLIVADIDHFKRVNDTLGHDGGDEVLRLVARALRTAVPPGALVARIGGEEFAIVAGGQAGFSPAVLLDRVRSERMPFDLTVTLSLGTATGQLATESDWNAMYRAADQALFAAKAAGRDRVRHGTLAAA